MATYLLWFRAAGIREQVFDTNHLSTVRGSSLALLAAPREVEKFLQAHSPTLGIYFDAVGFDPKDLASVPAARIFAGASQGAWRIDAEEDATAEHARKEVETFLREVGRDPKDGYPPFHYLSFVVDVVRGSDLAALKQAEANGRERRLRCVTSQLPEFKDGVQGFSLYDRHRPAYVNCEMKSGSEIVSPSFKARCEYGRSQRQSFYMEHACREKAEGLDFAESFEDIIAEAPEELAASIRGKIAVFYADGNKFTKIRERAGSIAELHAFSETVLNYQRKMLGDLLDWLRKGGSGDQWEAYLQYPSIRNSHELFWPLRFETLMWGGDELTFVMPAWIGIAFARQFFEEWTKEWEFKGTPLTFGAGLVFCHEKTPIRQVRKMAQLLAEDAKGTLGNDLANVLQIEAFESIALPEYENGLERYRASLFGLGDDFDETKLARALTLRGDQINSVLDAIKTLKDGAFPRSQIYDLLRIAKKQEGGFRPDGAPGAADNDLAAAAQKYFTRMNGNGDAGLAKLRILGEGVPLAYSLAVISGLWDYVEPLALVPGNPRVGQPA